MSTTFAATLEAIQASLRDHFMLESSIEYPGWILINGRYALGTASGLSWGLDTLDEDGNNIDGIDFPGSATWEPWQVAGTVAVYIELSSRKDESTDVGKDGPGPGEMVRAQNGVAPIGCDPAAIVHCDRCNRTFKARYAACLCKG